MVCQLKVTMDCHPVSLHPLLHPRHPHSPHLILLRPRADTRVRESCGAWLNYWSGKMKKTLFWKLKMIFFILSSITKVRVSSPVNDDDIIPSSVWASCAIRFYNLYRWQIINQFVYRPFLSNPNKVIARAQWCRLS